MQGISRRGAMLGLGATALCGATPILAAKGNEPVDLLAAPSRQIIAKGKVAAVWSYNGTTPGPVLQARQGEPFKARLLNRLTQPSTVHWHGIRLGNAMDGVGGLTQAPVAPGGSFDYAFTPPDAGTYWYHPHEQSYEQVPRGLYGALVVAEANPPLVDQDLVLVISDWRMNGEGQVLGGFGSRHDQSHAGRLGNVITVNGQVEPSIPVRQHERLRVRLLNAATARVLAVRVNGADARLIAYDGQPVAPTSTGYGDSLVLGPGNRADLMLDVLVESGSMLELVDRRIGEPQVLARLRVEGNAARPKPMVAPIALAPNPVPVPDASKASRHELVMTGGAATEHDMRAMTSQEPIWFFNGQPGMSSLAPSVGAQHDHGAPLFRARRQETIALRIDNRTAWPHAMHLHGHHFKLFESSLGPVQDWWWDTLVVEPQEVVTIGFVADNPGRWMLHCHMLDHQAAGMMTVFDVA